MAASSILAPSTAGGSVDVTVADGASVTVGIYSATEAKFPESLYASVRAKTPGALNKMGVLTDSNRQTQVCGPITVTIELPSHSGTSFGIYSDVG